MDMEASQEEGRVDNPSSVDEQGRTGPSESGEPTASGNPNVRVVKKHFNIFINLIGHDVNEARTIISGVLSGLPHSQFVQVPQSSSAEDSMSSFAASGPTEIVHPVSATLHSSWQNAGPSTSSSPQSTVPHQWQTTMWSPARNSPGPSVHGSVPGSPIPGPSSMSEQSWPQNARSKSLPWERHDTSQTHPQCQICCQHKADKMIKDCGHFVCQTCVMPWLRVKKVCPNPRCRKFCDFNLLIDPKF